MVADGSGDAAYNAVVVTRGIREFLRRDWESVRRRKEAYWGDRIARLGVLEGFRIAEELRREVVLLNPMWPDRAHRQSDVQSHARVAGLLRRAGPARSR